LITWPDIYGRPTAWTWPFTTVGCWLEAVAAALAMSNSKPQQAFLLFLLRARQLQLAFALCRLDCIFPAALWRHLLATDPNSFLQSLAMRPLVTRTKLAKKTQGVAGSAGFLERQSGLLAAAAKLCRFLLSGPQHATFLGCSNLVWPLVIKWCGIFLVG
jgi:hypothetical protein